MTTFRELHNASIQEGEYREAGPWANLCDMHNYLSAAWREIDGSLHATCSPRDFAGLTDLGLQNLRIRLHDLRAGLEAALAFTLACQTRQPTHDRFWNGKPVMTDEEKDAAIRDLDQQRNEMAARAAEDEMR